MKNTAEGPLRRTQDNCIMSEEENTTTAPANIPIVTLARIFQDVSFRKENTRITSNTLKLSSEYIRLFIKEALIRSNEERLKEIETSGQVDGIDQVGESTNRNNQDSEFELDDDEIDVDMVPEPNTQQRAVSTGGGDTVANNMLDTRHLARVAGVLVLDF